MFRLAFYLLFSDVIRALNVHTTITIRTNSLCASFVRNFKKPSLFVRSKTLIIFASRNPAQKQKKRRENKSNASLELILIIGFGEYSYCRYFIFVLFNKSTISPSYTRHAHKNAFFLNENLSHLTAYTSFEYYVNYRSHNP